MFSQLFLLSYVLASIQGAKVLPENFLLGAGTSAYQTEGAWNVDGKGESIWDSILHETNSSANGDVACDSYHKWQEDVANAKELGLDFYKISISWSRILPNGTLNYINQKGVEYYQNLIKALVDEGIEPLVTIYHFDMPQHIYDLGGLMNPQFVDYFEDFARLVYQLYGSMVKYWITINEPLTICLAGYEFGWIAPFLELSGDGVYQCAYVVLKAHARAWRVYDEEFRHLYNGKVGITMYMDYADPATASAEDLEAQQRYFEFYLGWWAHPVFLGNWPQSMIQRIANRSKLEGLSRSRLPSFTQEEIDYINGTHDFFSLDTYGVRLVYNSPQPEIGEPSFDADSELYVNIFDNSHYRPRSIRDLVNYIQKKYNPSGIIINENGWQTEDILEDQTRIDFIKDYLGNVVDAVVEDGINIFGYSAWSFMDSFEWNSYDKKFGLIRVDFDSDNRTRTWKLSAYWYKNLTATRIIDID